MVYYLTLFWRSGPRGWTESYHRSADSARLASDLGGAVGLSPWLGLRAPPAELQAIRAEETTGLRRIYVREFHGAATTRDVTPDAQSVSARCWAPFADGRGGRSVWVRGIPDQWVRREAARGTDAPHPELTRRLERLSARVRALRLCGRRIVQSWTWHSHLHSAGAHPSQPTWTRVMVDVSPPVSVGDSVYLGGKLPCCPLAPERPYAVAEVTDSWLSLLAPWPDTLADQSMRSARLRVLEYEYPQLGELRFAEFSKHTTGLAYRPATWTYLEQRSPIDPCGRVMDYLRQTYRTTIRPYRDDPGIALPIGWYWCRPGVPEVPYDHPFGSRSWQLAEGVQPLIGEQFPRTRTSGADLTGLEGVGVCGSAEQWAWGPGIGDPLRLINPTTGQPCCCGPGLLLIGGGSAGGGEVEELIIAVGGGSAGGGEVEELADEGVMTVTCDRPMARKLRVTRTSETGACGCVQSPLDFNWDGVDRWRCASAGSVCGTATNYDDWYILPSSSGVLYFEDQGFLGLFPAFDCETGTATFSRNGAFGYCDGTWQGTIVEVW